MTSEEIRDFRDKNNLTQAELAEILGVKIGTVQSWEQGKRNISQSAIKLLHAYVPELDYPAKKQSAESGIENIIAQKVKELTKEEFTTINKKLDNLNEQVNQLIMFNNILTEKLTSQKESTKRQ